MKTLYNPDSAPIKFTFAAHEYELPADSELVLEDSVADHAIKSLARWGVCVIGDKAVAEFDRAAAKKAHKASLYDWCVLEAQNYSKKLASFNGTGFSPKPSEDEAFALDWLKNNF